MSDIKFPHIKVRLTGTDGNAIAVLGRVQKEMRRAGVAVEEVHAFFREATSGDYNHLLATCMKTVDVS